MSARVQRLRSDIAADVAALSRQVASVRELEPELLDGRAHRALLAWNLHHYYSALESVLERVAHALEGGLPAGRDSHRALLDGAFRPVTDTRPAVLSPTLAPALHDLRGFRHVVRHAYDAELDTGKLVVLRASLLSAHDTLLADLTRFDEWLAALSEAG